MGKKKPETGVLHNSKILVAHADGTTTEIKWDGECKVKAGDKVFLSTKDARIIVKGR